jgi:flagellar hook-associated protein 2
VELDVKTDVEAVKSSIIEFVGFYNQLLGRIDVLTRSDEQVIADIAYLDEEERKLAREQLGMLQGDLALNQMKGRMRETVAAPYPTSAGRDLSMLVQIGIGTDTARPGGGTGIDKSRLRGYLEIDEARLARAIEDRIDAVRELFGNDTDGDFVIDSGVAFAVAEGARPYIQPGGVIGTRVATIDQTAARRERDIATFAKQLEDKEARLQREYTMMEGALNTFDRSSRTLDNFSRGMGNTGQR